MKVLIIDDDSFDSELIASCFVKSVSDVEISILNDGRCAPDQCRSMRPDLALLDINMDALCGFEVLLSINKLPERQGMSVVMLSGSTNPQDKEKAESLGADGYRVKPSDLSGYRGLADELITLTRQ